MKKHLLFCLTVFAFFVIACNSDSTVQSENANKNEQSPSAEKPVNTNTIAENKKSTKAPAVFEKTVLMGNVNFKVYAENQETTTVKINCDGLSVRKFNQEFVIGGQVINAFGLDLDKDGYHELYIAVQGTDDSGNIGLIGIASYKDKSAGEITINEIEIPRKQNTDKVYAFYGELKREFYDQNNQLQVYSYKLKKGEAGFILEPTRTK